MLRRCAWCGLVLGQSEPLDEGGVTHGICLPCADRMLEEFRQTQAAQALVGQVAPSCQPTARAGVVPPPRRSDAAAVALSG